MALRMPAPWRSPSGIFYLRERIPQDLLKAAGTIVSLPVDDERSEVRIGTTHVKLSLRTRDPQVAKGRYRSAAGALAAHWQALRAGPRKLTAEQIAAIAGQAYRDWLARYGADADDPVSWDEERTVLAELLDMVDPNSDEHSPRRGWKLLEARLSPDVDRLLDRHGLQVDQATREALLKEVAYAGLQAAKVLEARAAGNFEPDPGANRFPDWRPSPKPATPKAPNPAPGKATLSAIVADWWKEAQAAGRKPSTHESYSNTVKRLIAFVKHDDAAQVTPDDVVGFKDHRLASTNPKTGKPISPKTVKDSDLAGLKTLFEWAVVNRRVASNPAAGVTIKLGKRRAPQRPKGFTDDEAKALLNAADEHQRGNENPKTHAAKRWVPWLCAYTGARVGEMAQLRRQDVRRVGEHWVIHISPEAGTVKTDEPRDVVVHEHLVDKGFLACCRFRGHRPKLIWPCFRTRPG